MGHAVSKSEDPHALVRARSARRRAADIPSLTLSFSDSTDSKPEKKKPKKRGPSKRRAPSRDAGFHGARTGSAHNEDLGCESANLIACVHLPELPLQMLLRNHPRWRRGPAAVVPEDRPDAPLLHLNPIAWRAGLRPGIRYGAAKQLVAGLHAAPVSHEEVMALAAELTTALHTFSPKVEGNALQAPPRKGLHRSTLGKLGQSEGTFYLDPSGLRHIYPSLRDWGLSIANYLKGREFRGAVVICEGRYRAFALARTRPASARLPVRVFSTKEDADNCLRSVLLEELDISPTLRTALEQLALRTVGDLLRVHPGELSSRLGQEAASLHAMLCGEQQLRLQPTPEEQPLQVDFEVDPPDADQERLLFHIKGALHGLLSEVESAGQVLRALRIRFTFEGGSSLVPDAHPEQRSQEQRIEPARGTRDAMMLMELVRLRLGAWALPGPVEAICLEAETEQAEGDQLHMFSCPKRDPAAAGRALARLVAAFGEQAVTKPVLREAHLPEASFAWEPVRSIRLPKESAARDARGATPTRKASSKRAAQNESEHAELDPPHTDSSNDASAPPLIRRLLHRPVPVHTNPRTDPSVSLYGPYRVSGGWWARPVLEDATAQPIERDYYYAETEDELLWLYYDRTQGRWYLQGKVD